MQRMEKEEKKNNIVMSGVDISTSDPKQLSQTMKNFIKAHLQIEVEVKSAVKLGQKTCLIKLGNAMEKTIVMQNKAKLRNLVPERVFINDDLTIKDRDKQKQIRLRAEEEKKIGKDVKIGYNKLTIDGIIWRWNNTTERLEKQPKN